MKPGALDGCGPLTCVSFPFCDGKLLHLQRSELRYRLEILVWYTNFFPEDSGQKKDQCLWTASETPVRCVIVQRQVPHPHSNGWESQGFAGNMLFGAVVPSPSSSGTCWVWSCWSMPSSTTRCRKHKKGQQLQHLFAQAILKEEERSFSQSLQADCLKMLPYLWDDALFKNTLVVWYVLSLHTLSYITYITLYNSSYALVHILDS